MSPNNVDYLTGPAVVLAGFLLSIVMEKLAKPATRGFDRPWFFLAIHGGLWLLAWSAVFLLLARPVFAAMAVLAGQFLVVLINNAKYRALREPFLFSDFGIFSQTIKHPRLYLPFLGFARAALAVLAGAAAAGVGWWLEAPQTSAAAWAAGGAAAGVALLAAGVARAPAPTLDPEGDLAHRGLFASIAQYWLREKRTDTRTKTDLPRLTSKRETQPDVIVIQSESFFDARRLFAHIKRDVLANYDAACAEAAMHGRLQVPAWGANTMRPEFSFLTGCPPESLDIHRFNPYRRLARTQIHALPAILRETGYSTTCIHPHPARFFRRDRAFPNLGFDRFVDDRLFDSADREGPYISDKAVTDKLMGELEATDQPSFFFVITMENHGPLHLEKVALGDLERLYTEPPPAGCEDLTVYLRHLQNADRELGRLRAFLAARSRPSLLCFYGEHLPSMPQAYDLLGLPDGRTDYFLQIPWGHDRIQADLSVAALPYQVLRYLGG